jgi:diaminopimelate decarboxylase
MYEYGIKYFVFDNINEYEKIKKLAPKAKKILRVFLNDIIPDTISFGMRYSDFKKYIATGQLDTKQVDGLTFYLSDNKNTENLYMVLQEVERFFAVLGSNKLLNIGGNYRLQSEVPSDFYIKLNSELNRLRKKYNTTVYAEPGRSVVKKAGTLLTKVIYFDNEKKYVYIDAGVPTGISYKPPIINNINQNDYKDRCEKGNEERTGGKIPQHRKLIP